MNSTLAKPKHFVQEQILQLRTQPGLQRGERLRALDEIFRNGVPPDPPLSGGYAGLLLAVDLAPGLTGLAQWLAGLWQPWRGKLFDPETQKGINLFSRDSLPVARLLWPSYRDYLPGGPDTYQAFPFRTYLGPGKFDSDRQVLKIDYDLALNPGWTIRRVLDELVQVAEGFYLGKANLKWWWGRWQTVAFFSLEATRRRENEPQMRRE